VFFAFVVDAFSRKVVGWQLAAHMRADLVLDALRMALHQRKPGAQVELVHHSDRGSQPALNRSSQQCVGGVTVGMVAEPRRCGWAVVTRLSSRRPARRAGRSGDSSVRACRTPVGCQRLGVRAQRPAGRTGRAAFRQRGSGTRSAFRRAFASRAFSGAGC
jgi:hypothetical protein